MTAAIHHHLLLLVLLQILSTTTSSLHPSLHNINRTLEQIQQLHTAQRYEESKELGTTFLLELISGPNLHVLSEQHQDAVAIVLDTTPVDLNARTSRGETLLHSAVRRSSVPIVCFFFFYKIALGAGFFFFFFFLLFHHVYILYADFDFLTITLCFQVQLLIFSNATEINAQSDDGLYTALHLAVEYASFEILYYLVINGKADGNIRDRRGNTPLHSACLRSDLKTIQFLIQHYPSSAYIKDYFGGGCCGICCFAVLPCLFFFIFCADSMFFLCLFFSTTDHRTLAVDNYFNVPFLFLSFLTHL